MLRREYLRKPEEGICSAIRREATERAEERRVFVMLRVVSCGGDQRWRTKLHLGSREPLDDHHRSSTLGTEPKIARVAGACRVLFGRWSCSCAEQLKTKWQVGGTFAIGQEAEVPDAHEAIRKQVQQEATQEFIE